MSYGHCARELVKSALELFAIKFNFQVPFRWSSGYCMPIYNDNRLFMAYPEKRKLIANGFIDLILEESIDFDLIAGVATGGISPATTLADWLNVPLIYVRSSAKNHGLERKIEGLNAENIVGKKVLVIEDLVSTGNSSAQAVETIREAQGTVDCCLAIFSYGFKEAEERFGSLTPACKIKTIFGYDLLIEVVREENYLQEKYLKILEEWKKDPFNWWKGK